MKEKSSANLTAREEEIGKRGRFIFGRPQLAETVSLLRKDFRRSKEKDYPTLEKVLEFIFKIRMKIKVMKKVMKDCYITPWLPKFS